MLMQRRYLEYQTNNNEILFPIWICGVTSTQIVSNRPSNDLLVNAAWRSWDIYDLAGYAIN
jgi:hypothetical protein